MSLPSIVFTPDHVSITWADECLSEYHAEWLADNIPSNRDPRTGQRLIDVTDLPEHPRIESAGIDGDVMRVGWTGGGAAAYPLGWLSGESRRHQVPRAMHVWHG